MKAEQGISMAAYIKAKEGMMAAWENREDPYIADQRSKAARAILQTPSVASREVVIMQAKITK